MLVLQIVATLSLDPQHHKAVLDSGMPDVLSQLLLPSDEWYYTNHSTKYARYVKHHVARILVYLGFQHRVNLRFCVYDILQGTLTKIEVLHVVLTFLLVIITNQSCSTTCSVVTALLRY